MRRFFYDTEFMEHDEGLPELLSIGVVDEGGRDLFYACNKDADLTRANEWVQKNVLPFLGIEGAHVWHSLSDIQEQLRQYFRPAEERGIELWGYYSAYDHVLLCKLLGPRMIDLPAGFPRITYDLRQYANLNGILIEKGIRDDDHHALSDARWIRKVFFDIWRE